MIRIRRNPRFDPAEVVENRSIEQFRIKAQAHARNFLCLDCYDQRCRNDSICPAFITVTEDICWELIAKVSELN